MNSRVFTALIASISAAAGAGATLWVVGGQPNGPPALADSRELDELRGRIEELAEQLRIATLSAEDEVKPPKSAVPEDPLEERVAAPPVPSETEAPRRENWEQRERERLLAAGWTEPEIEEVQSINSSVRLRMLEEGHLATRELRQKYPEVARMLQLDRRNPLRESLGDERYASYLEASGRPSAVRVRSLIPGSAGESVGLREGDMIRSYAGERVFGFIDIERATYEGEYGEPVTIEVVRDGATYFLTIPRGPIGTTFQRRD